MCGHRQHDFHLPEAEALGAQEKVVSKAQRTWREDANIRLRFCSCYNFYFKRHTTHSHCEHLKCNLAVAKTYSSPLTSRDPSVCTRRAHSQRPPPGWAAAGSSPVPWQVLLPEGCGVNGMENQAGLFFGLILFFFFFNSQNGTAYCKTHSFTVTQVPAETVPTRMTLRDSRVPLPRPEPALQPCQATFPGPAVASVPGPGPAVPSDRWGREVRQVQSSAALSSLQASFRHQLDFFVFPLFCFCISQVGNQVTAHT